ncbi:MAG: GntR family transcriptional regulator [Lachnospiraceae bacterium]|nr:GntR family transcriptional regulator [Lachnospiraceae bacterium]
MKILISNTSNLAIYEQIVHQIKDAVIAGEITAGEMLPSIRSLAKDLQISVITTKRAYEELEKEGLIYSVAGKGFYIAEQNTNMLKEKKVQILEKELEKLAAEWRKAGLAKEDMIDYIRVLFEEWEDEKKSYN